MAASSNLGLLFFVVALIQICFLIVLICRTAIPIFSCAKYPNERPMQIFRAFYGSLWIQTFLNSVLYWVLFGFQAGKGDVPGEDDEGFKSVVLIFLPTILMSLDYALIYLQLDDMNKRARVQGGVAYMQQDKYNKLVKIVNIITFVYVGIFILVQVALMILTMFNLIKPSAFLAELNTLILFLMIFLNIYSVTQYCRNAGNPYLTPKHRKYVHKYKLVVVIWNVAFIIKFFMTFFGVSIVDIDEKSTVDDFWYSVETFVNIMFTDIIPFYFVLDKKIIKIFTCQFLEIASDDSQMAPISGHDGDAGNSSQENSIDLENDEEEKYLNTAGSGQQRLLSGGKNSPTDQTLSSMGADDELSRSQRLTMCRLTMNGNVTLSEAAIQQERARLEKTLTLKLSQFTRQDAFTRAWYSSERKFLKTKLGNLYQCAIENKEDGLCRVMHYDRISSYQIEAFFTVLARINLYKMGNFMVMPKGVYVSPKMEITVILPELISLHDIIHEPQRINGSEEGLDLRKKIAVLLELAKVLNQFATLASPLAHGNLNSHNVFVDLSSDSGSDDPPKIKLGELEMSDFKRYANMFYSYRSVSVWSAPECLKQQKKRLDPTTQMDVYSFGMLMWEVLYEKLPFDGDLTATIEYVVTEDARPLIQTYENTTQEDVVEDALLLTEDLANIIRRCWQTDVKQRPAFTQVIKMLLDQQQVLFNNDQEDNDHQLIGDEDM